MRSLRPRLPARSVIPRTVWRLPLALPLVLIVLVVLVGCADRTTNGPTGPDDVSGVALPAALRRAVADARATLRVAPVVSPAAADLALYYDLRARIQRAADRTAAGDELYVRWRAEPTNFLWVDLAARFSLMLQRKADRDAMYASPALADSLSPVGRFVLGRRFYGRGDRGRFYRLANADLERLDPLQQVWLTLKLAMVESDCGDHLAAVERLLAWTDRARAAGGCGLEAELWNDLAECLRRADRLDGAVHAAALAHDLAAHVRLDYLALQSRLALAGILGDRRETAASLAVLEDCITTAVRLDLPFLQNMSLDRAASLLTDLGDWRRAMSYDLRSLDYAKAMRDSLNVPRILMSIANSCRQLGQLDSCLAYQQRARIWVDRFPSARNRSALPAMLAPYYCQIGDYVTADSLLRVAGELAPTASTAPLEADLQIDLIREAMDLDAPDLAYRALYRLRELEPMLRDEQQAADYAIAAAGFLTRQGELPLALAMLERAAPGVAARGGEERRWRFERLRGELALLRGDPAGAEAAFRDALRLAESIGHEDWIADVRFHLGRVLLDNGRFDEAKRLFATAVDSTYGGRFRTELASRLFLGIACSRAGHASEALTEFSRAHALCARRSPGDLLVRLHVETGRAQTAAGFLAAAERSLLDAVALLRSRGGASWAADLPAFSSDLWRDAAESLIALYIDHPTLLAGREVGGVTLALAREGCGRRGADRPGGIVYFVGRERSFAWTDAAGGRERMGATWTLPSRRELAQLLAPVLADMEQPDRPVDEGAVRALSATLLAPLGDRWRPGEVLVIEPDDILCAVPWAALTLPDGDVVLDHGPLVEAAPQAAPALARRDAIRPGELLAIGHDGGATDPADGASTRRLREAAAEAREIAALWPDGRAHLLVGPAASWDNLERTDLRRFAVIHIATHAVAWAGPTAAATLRLADESGGHPLTAPAIRKLDLAADLVVLSCCEAASRHGSGLTDLAGAFLQAGCASVLASTVRVDDRAARQLARGFYAHWLAGQSKAAALQAALRDLRSAGDAWRHPYYWAFYRLIDRGAVAGTQPDP